MSHWEKRTGQKMRGKVPQEPQKPSTACKSSYLNCREACELYLLADEKKQVQANGEAYLWQNEMVELLGDNWEWKLRDVSARKFGDAVFFNMDKLSEHAMKPVEPREISLMVCRRIGGAEKTHNFLLDRPNSPHESQSIEMLSTFVDKFLGKLWRDRLEKSTIAFEEKKIKGEDHCLIPIAEVKRFAGDEIARQMLYERQNPGRRSYGHKE